MLGSEEEEEHAGIIGEKKFEGMGESEAGLEERHENSGINVRLRVERRCASC
ncbi:uncharacterized protein DS421_20g678120 [Arachis hypogaea]|nr:uncharacterized protein DS421_20g678120 [Arachis hypogaea]